MCLAVAAALLVLVAYEYVGVRIIVGAPPAASTMRDAPTMETM
ncbi:MAG TPA: hypothetical protein VI818_01585 [Candidatus Thermoplasmatota archaeon]|nr:hypothetical protein [Candidatus Thermoplasmatota archaeon]